MQRSREALPPPRAPLVLAIAFVVALGGPAARADDDDSPSSDSSSSSSNSPNASSSGGEGGRGGIDLGPNPGSGNVLADLRSVAGLIFGQRPAPPPPPLPPTPAPSNQASADLVVAGLTDAQRRAAEVQGFTVVAERANGLVRGRVMRLRGPAGMTTATATAQLRAIAPGARIAPNTLYRPSALPCAASGCTHLAQVNWPEAPRCGDGLRIGLVDTRINSANPALAGAALRAETTRSRGYRASSTAHGTAVAALLVGKGPGVARGLVPGATLIAADPFHLRSDGDAADAFDLVAAIDLLAARDVAVINLSLAGPANAVLDDAGAAAAARGILLVAAAGNGGPRAPVAYPAAYPWAIAVTAVDARGEIYTRAVRGGHIAFAAPGVGLPVVGANGAAALRSGTSFATPFVSAALLLGEAEDGDPAAAVRRLAGAARDLGPPGRDPVFGWGLVQPAKGC
ncbi:S8 family serine peptidase [Elioraea sp.]|uniref:S8 family serine peptidase n=1 Tax=Elioraea sp. TaxID=2185103 RepID=UPI0025B8B070|nr:S8 family serine peptidase [Elioraea sp.]